MCHLVDFAIPANQIPRSCLTAEEALEHEGNDDINCSWCPWNSFQRPRKDTGRTWRSEEESRPSRPQFY